MSTFNNDMTDQQVHDAFDEVTVGVGASKQGVLLKNHDGRYVNVDTLDLSDNVKQLLKAADAEGNGSVDDENVLDILQVLGTMKNVFGKNGKMSHSEIENGLGLLQRLVKEKDMNSGEMSYGHLPECIKEVMTEWDIDRSGSVNVLELSAAAKAHKKVKEEGRMMKKIILGLFGLILILLTGVLVMSYLAVEMAKEMRATSDGTMKNNDGEVVKVASSAFDVQSDGTLVTRDGPTSPVLQVAQSKPKRQLTSTLPDDALKKLDMVSLKEGEHFVQLKVNGMQRIQTKSSKCGSVVELKTAEGILTLDDYTISADSALAAFLNRGGMASALGDGVFGRRLSQGFLDGFFTQLEDVEWPCTSVQLPQPQDIPKSYHAKIQVREAVKQVTLSSFQNADADLLLAGMVKEGDNYFLTWTEDALSLPSFKITSRHYEMHPLQSQLDVTMNGIGHNRAWIDRMGTTGHNCHLGPGQMSLGLESLVAQASNLQLVALVHEQGMVLRHWRMEVASSAMPDAFSQSAIEQGIAPNIILDYFDVDTDPTEKFQSGYPYRIHAFAPSCDSGCSSVYNVSLQFLEISPVADMNLPNALDFLGVKKLSAACQVDPLASGKSGFTTLGSEIEKIGIEPAEKVPKIDPWKEMVGVVKFNSDKLKDLVQLSPNAPEVQLVRASRYWKSIMSSIDQQNLLTQLHSSQIENGPTEYERLLGGVTLKVEVQYTPTGTDSLPGGIQQIKVIAKGTALGEGGIQVPVDVELQIAASSRVGGYASSCSVTSSSASMSPLSGESIPVTVIMCLTEEYDYIRFSSKIMDTNPSGPSFNTIATETTFSEVNVVTKSRELCAFVNTILYFFCPLAWP